MMPQQITFVCADDWEGLYVDGKLATQGHSLTIQDVLEHIGIGSVTLWANEEWLIKRGSLPERLKQVRTNP